MLWYFHARRRGRQSTGWVFCSCLGSLGGAAGRANVNVSAYRLRTYVITYRYLPTWSKKASIGVNLLGLGLSMASRKPTANHTAPASRSAVHQRPGESLAGIASRNCRASPQASHVPRFL